MYKHNLAEMIYVVCMQDKNAFNYLKQKGNDNAKNKLWKGVGRVMRDVSQISDETATGLEPRTT